MSNEKLIPTETKLLDVAALKLSQSFHERLGVTKRQISIPVTKPHNQWFFRTHKDPSFWFETTLLKLKDENEFYIVEPSVALLIPDQVQASVVITGMTRTGNLFLWPIRLPNSQGQHSQWHQSALMAANTAKDTWIKISANRALGAYDTFEATGNLPEPEWPQLSFSEILSTAFKNFFISTTDHPVLKQLQGEL